MSVQVNNHSRNVVVSGCSSRKRECMNAPFYAKKAAAFDPYADLDQPAQAQAQLPHEPQSAGGDPAPAPSSSSSSPSTNNTKKRSLDVDVNDIEPVLMKLHDHLVGTNTMKIEKAAGLMVQYLNSKLDKANVDLFLKYITSLEGKDDEIYASSYAKIFSAIRDKKSVFGSELEHRITSNYVFYCLSKKLTTDDSFEFIVSCKELSSYISDIGDQYHADSVQEKCEDGGEKGAGRGNGEGNNEEEIHRNNQYRMYAILRCMETSYKKYHFLWARSPIESMFLKATGLRSSLDEKCLKRLDELVNKQEVERRKRTSSAGPQTVRRFNSVHNPLAKKQANSLLR